MSHKSEAEGILYELLVYSEWIQEPEILVCIHNKYFYLLMYRL